MKLPDATSDALEEPALRFLDLGFSTTIGSTESPRNLAEDLVEVGAGSLLLARLPLDEAGPGSLLEAREPLDRTSRAGVAAGLASRDTGSLDARVEARVVLPAGAGVASGDADSFIAAAARVVLLLLEGGSFEAARLRSGMMSAVGVICCDRGARVMSSKRCVSRLRLEVMRAELFECRTSSNN